ncbi:MAG: DUF1700 domain-containing protein [Alphaproteobacteria bacterium]|nr:DUF1700 domain-containing protein [Alphaproteobacteria bacterium]
MTRNEFMTRLRQGLVGLDPDYIRDVMNDYETHFEDGEKSGRSEQEIAAALGDPGRLARELRAEAGFRRWENERTPGNLAGAVLGLMGLATVDVLFLFPFLCAMFGIFIGCSVAVLVLVVVGIALIIAALFPGLAWFGLTGGVELVAVGLVGLGMAALGIGLGALFSMIVNFIVKALVNYARLHFRLINTVTQEA